MILLNLQLFENWIWLRPMLCTLLICQEHENIYIDQNWYLWPVSLQMVLVVEFLSSSKYFPFSFYPPSPPSFKYFIKLLPIQSWPRNGDDRSSISSGGDFELRSTIIIKPCTIPANCCRFYPVSSSLKTMMIRMMTRADHLRSQKKMQLCFWSLLLWFEVNEANININEAQIFFP